MARTYEPTAVKVGKRAYDYLTRYQATLVQGATGDQISALADLITCLAAFLQKWLKPPVLP